MPQELVDIGPADERLHGPPIISQGLGKYLILSASAPFLLLLCILLVNPIKVSLPASASELGRQAFLAQDVDALLDRRLERVVPFVNWTYGWAASYANSYIVAAKVIAAILQGHDNWYDVTVGTMREQELRVLRERVTRPEADSVAITALIDRHVRSRLFSDRAKLSNSYCEDVNSGSCPSLNNKDIDAAAISILSAREAPAHVAQEQKAIADLLSIESNGEVDFLHTLRPLVSRFVILLLRITELTSVVVLITAGLRRIYLPNTPIVRVIVTLGIAWGLDYGVLRLERAINERAFETQITHQLQAQNRAVKEYVAARVDEAENAFAQKVAAIYPELRKWQ